jgi:ABC-type Fe3+-siderophore transport system permease subunit
MEGAEVLIPISMFASTFGILYVYFSSRHRERMALIDKGADPSLFRNPIRSGAGTLKFGLLLVGVALGILMGALLTGIVPAMREETANFSMIFLFGGLALIVNHLIEAKKGAQQGGDSTQGK